MMLALFLLSACAMARHREYVRDGFLMTGLNRNAFLSEWGHPTRTYSTTGEEIAHAHWNIAGGSFARGKQQYDVWEYDSDITLVFAGFALVA